MNSQNKKLSLILAGLVVLFLIVRWVKADKKVSTFKTQLFVLDTAQVNTIKLYPQVEAQEEIRFGKDINAWNVSKGNIQSTIPKNQVQNLLGSLLTIKPQRMAARSSDKWSTYQVDDSLGTRVVLEDAEGKKLADLVIGKFSYRQVAPQNNFGGGQNNIQGWTYVRNYEEEETYATDGFLSMSFNRDFNSFRDRKMVECNPNFVKNIRFQAPNNAGFTLSKLGDDWRMGDVLADSTKVANYLNQLRSLSGTDIDDTANPSGAGDYQWVLSGDNMADISVTAFTSPTGFNLRSSINPNTVFSSDSTGVFSQIFKQSADFVADELQ